MIDNELNEKALLYGKILNKSFEIYSEFTGGYRSTLLYNPIHLDQCIEMISELKFRYREFMIAFYHKTYDIVEIKESRYILNIIFTYLPNKAFHIDFKGLNYLNISDKEERLIAIELSAGLEYATEWISSVLTLDRTLSWLWFSYGQTVDNYIFENAHNAPPIKSYIDFSSISTNKYELQEITDNFNEEKLMDYNKLSLTRDQVCLLFKSLKDANCILSKDYKAMAKSIADLTGFTEEKIRQNLGKDKKVHDSRVPLKVAEVFRQIANELDPQ